MAFLFWRPRASLAWIRETTGPNLGTGSLEPILWRCARENERALRNRAPGRRRQAAPSFGWAARHAAKRRQNGALGLARGAAHRGGLFENVGSYGGNRFVGLLGPPIGAAFACGRSRSRRSALFRLKRRCSRLPPLCGSASQPGRCFCRSARKPKGLGWQRILGVAGSLCFDAAS